LVPQGGGPARIRPVQAERRRRATRALSSGRSNGVGREASVGKTDPGAWCDQRGPRQLAGASLWSRASREESPSGGEELLAGLPGRKRGGRPGNDAAEAQVTAERRRVETRRNVVRAAANKEQRDAGGARGVETRRPRENQPAG